MKNVIAAGGVLTAEAGREMFAMGGNAADAAVAAAFTSFVAEVGVVHLGGSGIAQVYDPANGRSRVYDFLSTMPGLAGKAESPLDFEAVVIDFGATRQSFHLGRASVAVPGNVFGLCRIAGDLGRLPLSTLLQPAIRAARAGAALDVFQAETCELLRPLYTHTAGMRSIFAPDGHMLRPGERVRIPGLADTLEAIATEGETALREGDLARSIVEDQAEHGGLLSADDLRRYEVQVAAPTRVRYRGYDVLLPAAPSVGGLLLSFTIALLAEQSKPPEPGGEAWMRRFYEAMALTAEARARADAAYGREPMHALTQVLLAGEVVADAAKQLRERLTGGAGTRMPEPPKSVGNTSHLTAVDADGMAVSLTTTAGETAGYVVPGTGFVPNNMLGEADVNPLGWHRWPAGARIPSMMSPTIVLDRGRVRLATGSGGSERIRSAILQVLLRVLDHDIPIDEAVERARVHPEGDVLQCEAGFDEPAVAALEARGYPVNRWPKRSIYFGGAHSVARDAEGEWRAHGDSRRAGAVAVQPEGSEASTE